MSSIDPFSHQTAAIAEIYGTAHLGGIHSLFVALMVFGAATRPLLLGLLLDNDYNFVVILVMAISQLFGRYVSSLILPII